MAHQVQKNGATGFTLEVYADTAFVAVEREVVSAHAVAGVLGVVLQQSARAFTGAGRFHLDGARSQVGQQHGAVRPREHVGKVQDGDVFKCHDGDG